MINKAVLWNLSYGVYVVSSMDNERPIGCVANCAMQLTHDCVAVSINHENYTNKVIKENKTLAISILSNNADKNVIPIFGFSSSKENDKFEDISYQIIENLPVIKNANSYLTLEVVQELELETHTLFIGKITSADVLNNDTPMTYKYYHDVIKGRAPKTAPTYVEEEIISNGATKYKCSVCGYVYEGDITKESDDFICPICIQPKSYFEKA